MHVCDASQEGALLAVADPDNVPDEFILALSSSGAARRHCRVAWRTTTRSASNFVKDLKKNAPGDADVGDAFECSPACGCCGVSGEPAVQVDIDTLAPR